MCTKPSIHSFNSFDCLVLVCLLMKNSLCLKHAIDVVQLLRHSIIINPMVAEIIDELAVHLIMECNMVFTRIINYSAKKLQHLLIKSWIVKDYYMSCTAYGNMHVLRNYITWILTFVESL